MGMAAHRVVRGVAPANGHVRYECQARGCRWFVETWPVLTDKANLTTPYRRARAAVREHREEQRVRPKQ